MINRHKARLQGAQGAEKAYAERRHHEGGPNAGAPAMPAAGAAGTKAVQARRKRQKESYGIIAKHITNKDITEDLQKTHFQDGHTAFQAIRTSGTIAVDTLQMRSVMPSG